MHYNDQGADFKYLIVNERDKRFGLSVTTVGSLKDEELSPATQPRLSTYPKGRYFSCFPDSGIPMRRCKRQDGTNITSVLKARL